MPGCSTNALPFFSNSPLHPFMEQIERDAGFQSKDTPEERLIKLESLLIQATNDATVSAPLLAAMLSIPTGSRYHPRAHDPQQQKDLTIEALIQYLIGRARQQPLLVVVEDVHWADPTTLELLERLIDRMASERVLLLVTFRPEFAERWHSRPHVTLISLIEPALIVLTTRRSGTAGAGRWSGSAAAAWRG